MWSQQIYSIVLQNRLNLFTIVKIFVYFEYFQKRIYNK